MSSYHPVHSSNDSIDDVLRKQRQWKTRVILGVAAVVAMLLSGVVGYYIRNHASSTPSTTACWPADFSSLSDVAPDVMLDIRYYTAHNFMGRRVQGYNAPLCVLTTAAAKALALVQADAKAAGYTLKVASWQSSMT
jgi:D-alanyl-D-alanine dipeptidase